MLSHGQSLTAACHRFLVATKHNISSRPRLCSTAAHTLVHAYTRLSHEPDWEPVLYSRVEGAGGGPSSSMSRCSKAPALYHAPLHHCHPVLSAFSIQPSAAQHAALPSSRLRGWRTLPAALHVQPGAASVRLSWQALSLAAMRCFRPRKTWAAAPLQPTYCAENTPCGEVASSSRATGADQAPLKQSPK